jgi:hypothetical protein
MHAVVLASSLPSAAGIFSHLFSHTGIIVLMIVDADHHQRDMEMLRELLGVAETEELSQLLADPKTDEFLARWKDSYFYADYADEEDNLVETIVQRYSFAISDLSHLSNQQLGAFRAVSCFRVSLSRSNRFIQMLQERVEQLMHPEYHVPRPYLSLRVGVMLHRTYCTCRSHLVRWHFFRVRLLTVNRLCGYGICARKIKITTPH